MEENGFWDKEDFEDLVARGLIAMYENKLKKHKFAHKSFRFTQEMLYRIRNVGCYFPCHDRLCVIDCVNENSEKAAAIQNIDVSNDGRPDFAIKCNAIDIDHITYTDDMRKDCYLEISYLERINVLPSPVKCDFEGRKYRLVNLWARSKLLEGVCEYVVIDSKGNIHGTYWIRSNYNPLTNLPIRERVDARIVSEKDNMNSEDFTTLNASTTIQFWQDRRYLWNVVAKEGLAKATFTVYPEQIKSLFYSREMPMTETGRKRPILHWVAAHHRRLKNGIDIDIEKHLRGINEFVYQGTKFIITRPLKVSNLKNNITKESYD